MDLSGVAYIWWQKDMDNENKNVTSLHQPCISYVGQQLNDVGRQDDNNVDGSTTGADKVFFKKYVQ